MNADNSEPRQARVGTSNPERINNPFWHFRIAHALACKGLIPKDQADTARSAWKSANRNKSTSDGVVHPLWSFDRFGQTETALPDGRVLFVGGEHEDWYDPDFFIYNDVVVLHPDRRIEIFCYPETIFPPTDFHSATLVETTLILIGSIGYPGQRRYGRTQVYNGLASRMTQNGYCVGALVAPRKELWSRSTSFSAAGYSDSS